MSPLQLCQKAEIAAGTLVNIMSGTRGTSDDLVAAIGRSLHLTRRDQLILLATGAHDRTRGRTRDLWREMLAILRQPATPPRAGDTRPLTPAIVPVPLYEQAWAGLDQDGISGHQIGEFAMPRPPDGARAFGLFVNDDAMQGEGSWIARGGFVLFEAPPPARIREGSIVCAQVPGNPSLVIRRFQRDIDGGILLLPENPRYAQLRFPPTGEQPQILGHATGFWRPAPPAG